jgi:hypothetical protein
LCTESWTRRLVELAGDGRLVTTPGPHTFLWLDPSSWSEPIRTLTTAVRS